MADYEVDGCVDICQELDDSPEKVISETRWKELMPTEGSFEQASAIDMKCSQIIQEAFAD